nr:TetR family transcriptional regulator [Microbacterium bovistercoris]
MTSHRDRAIAAAIELLASGGIRALTHLRVDERAGFPRGSTSNVFRTREALLLGVCEYMVASELPEIATGFAASTPDEFAESLTALFRYLVGPSRTMTTARLALIVEGGHDAAVRSALAAGRVGIERSILPALVALGAPDPLLGVQLIATCFEGLFLHVIGRHAHIDAEAVIAATVRTIFAPVDTAR